MAFCASCGAELPPGAEFCPKCGRSAGAQAGPGPEDWMSRREMRRMHRQERREARWAAWASPEMGLINTVFGGLVVILLGVVLYLAAAGITPQVTWSNFWAYFLLGLGLLLVIRGVLTLFARMPWDSYGNIVGGVILMVIGGAFVAATQVGWSQYLWIVAIVIIGLIIIMAGVAAYLFRPH